MGGVHCSSFRGQVARILDLARNTAALRDSVQDALSVTLGCDKLGVCQQKWQTDEFIRQNLTNFWRTFRQNSSKVFQNLPDFAKIANSLKSEKFWPNLSRKTVKFWKKSQKSRKIAKNCEICRNSDFGAVQRNAHLVDLEKSWKMRLLSLS